MTNVYGRTTFYVAAAGAVDESKDLFPDREETWRCCLREHSSEAAVSRILLAYGQEVVRRMANMPLWAWAVQERILPHRNISLTQREILRDCDSELACESYPHGGGGLDPNA